MDFRTVLVIAGVCLLVAAVFCVSVYAIEKADHGVFDSIDYSQAEAENLWVPMAGSKKVSIAEARGRSALEFYVNFSGTKIDRASWDRQTALDLTMCKGVEFMFYSDDVSNVSHFVMYFHSVDGWYTCNFVPDKTGEWTQVRIDKRSAQIEGRPGGWDKVDTIRLSAWRGGERDTKFYISNLGRYGTDAKVVILRGDSAAKTSPNEVRNTREYAEVTAGFLDAVGLSYFVISDEDFRVEKMEKQEVLILPFNPSMPEEIVSEVEKFVAGGGKLIACYTLPGRLAERAGIKIGKHIKQKREGQFDSIRAAEGLRGKWPMEAKQRSWNIRDAKAVEGRGSVAARWYDDKGEPTGKAAVILGDDCVYMTHVLLKDDAVNKQYLLLSMIGSMSEELWREAAEYSIDQMGNVGGFEDYQSARDAIIKLGTSTDEVIKVINRADEKYKRSRRILSEGKFCEAIVTAREGRDLMIEGYCRAQKAVWPEHRAFWCHSAFGVRGMEWDEAIRRLAENGFTAVVPNMLWGGVAFYESDILPVAEEITNRGDQIELCVKACRKYGVECHVWKVNFNMGWATSKEFATKMKEAARTQVRFDGSDNDRWLCPSHSANRKLEIESMVEIVRKYDVDGVHFDYIRYPDENGCFCKACRERFEKWAKIKVKNWPGDVREDEKIADKWLDFRREQITPVVKGVAEGARAIRKDIKISAAVFRNWPVDRNTIGQDWKMWCEKGWLDFVCPMNYTESTGQFEWMTREQLKWVGDVPCYPGIGLSVWQDPKDICKLIEQIGITRKLGTGGFTIFNYGPSEAGEIVEKLGMGMTKRQVSGRQ